jgi:hypothetical protein
MPAVTTQAGAAAAVYVAGTILHTPEFGTFGATAFAAIVGTGGIWAGAQPTAASNSMMMPPKNSGLRQLLRQKDLKYATKLIRRLTSSNFPF